MAGGMGGRGEERRGEERRGEERRGEERRAEERRGEERREGRKGQTRGREKGNWLLIPIRAIMGIWAGDLTISGFGKEMKLGYLMFE